MQQLFQEGKMDYMDEELKRNLRHIATHLNAYWAIQNGANNKLSPKVDIPDKQCTLSGK